MTARNAEIHHRKTGHMEGFATARNSKEDGTESDVTEGQFNKLWLWFIHPKNFDYGL